MRHQRLLGLLRKARSEIDEAMYVAAEETRHGESRPCPTEELAEVQSRIRALEMRVQVIEERPAP